MKNRFNKNIKPRGPLANQRIRAREVRTVDESGQQLGVLSLEEALKIAREKNLDLIQVTERVEPPVCKIGDLGKYLYQQKKKEKSQKNPAGEIKGIRLTFAISPHDLQTRAKKSKEFLEKGYKVMIEMRLYGRQKGSPDFAREKIQKFLEIVKQETEIKIERDLKRESRGMTMIITKA